MSAYPSRFAPAAALESVHRQLRADQRRARLTHPSRTDSIGESGWHWSDLKTVPLAIDEGTMVPESAPPRRANAPLAVENRIAPWHA